MEKETPQIKPETTETITTPVSFKPAPAANETTADAEKEKRQAYYVDPLEQDALMAKKRETNPNIPTNTPAETPEEAPDEQPVKPNINVNGMFSNGQTKSKKKMPATIVIIILIAVGIVIVPLVYALVMALVRF